MKTPNILNKPVEWIAPNGDRWILSNLASQQNLFRTLDGLTKITGDPKYRQAAMEAIEYAFANLRTPNGLFNWGGHSAYDVGADEACEKKFHEMKAFYPYYELMYEVNSEATKQFVGSFWSAHILDWSNLDMNRHGSLNERLEKPWRHKYEGGPVFFKGEGSSFISTGSDLYYAAAILFKLSGYKGPLIWSKRLAHRYVETRNPTTGIGGGVYSLRKDWPKHHLADDFKGHTVHKGSILNIGVWTDQEALRNLYEYVVVSPGVIGSGSYSPPICQFLIGEMLGAPGKEFQQWALEELSAWGQTAYRQEDNSWIPMLTDGTSLEGYVHKRDISSALKGTVIRAQKAGPRDFWAYALAYRITGDKFMWQMARSIAQGNDFGDIGADSEEETRLKMRTDCLDPHALLGFLSLHERSRKGQFLDIAERIGDNILSKRFYKGFFVPSKKHIYAKFDAIESLVLLQLHYKLVADCPRPPVVWPSRVFFSAAYRHKVRSSDSALIYTLTESPEPPISLSEAAAMGNTELVKSLIAEGADVNVREDNSYRAALHRAVMSGHTDIVEILLAKGADVNIPDGSSVTALYYAAEKGDKEIAELLIAKGADINVKRGNGDTPLHCAAMAGYKDIVELLIANGAKINAKNNEGQTSVDIAASQRRNEVVRLLIAKGADVSLHVAVRFGALAKKVEGLLQEGVDINAKDGSGQTALHHAVRGGHKELTEFLIAKGADVNAKAKGGNTPLTRAIRGGNKDIIRVLVTKGADVNFASEDDYPPLHYAVWNKDVELAKLLVNHGAKFDMKDKGGWTAFRYAASQGDRQLVEFFVSKGADVSSFHMAACVGDLARVKNFVEQGTDVNAKDKLGWSPLFWAASTGQTDVAEFLITKGANVNVETNNNSRPLHRVAQVGGRKLAELLISKGAEVNAKTKNGNTPLHNAASAGHREVIELLIAKGANVNVRSSRDRTPLHDAARRGHGDVAEALLVKDANIYAKDRLDQTALHLAASMGQKDMVALLIAKGADLNSRDVNGQTPLHLSVRQGRRDTAELLITKGADVNAKNKWGRTPLDIAVDRGHTEIVELFRKHGAKE